MTRTGSTALRNFFTFLGTSLRPLIIQQPCARLSPALFFHSYSAQYRSDNISMENPQGNTTTVWNGSGLTQEEFMKKDECILVNETDDIVGHSSKYQAHRFEGQQPSGLLHRAFSVFLFDEDDRLLLQQRAASKITFPNVWTNTCCSHPLHGYYPTEVDHEDDVKQGKAPGATRAAIRKLEHELGIVHSTFEENDFKFLTRLHYCARDDLNDPLSPWGEHEMDYILISRMPRAKVVLNLNADEVQDTKYVTREELQKMMHPDSGLLWSPWFRIIAEKFLDIWWRDLDKTLHTDLHVDVDHIHSILK